MSLRLGFQHYTVKQQSKRHDSIKKSLSSASWREIIKVKEKTIKFLYY